MKVTTIGFDADDTLWHNERFYVLTQDRFADLLSDYTDRTTLDERLLDSEKRNIGHYGYGIKGFMLSMIETAIEVTDGRVPATVINRILEIGQDMLRHPIELLPHAEAAVKAMAASHHRVLLITKGDLLDQERKLTESGLWEYFDGVEIVSEKSPDVYGRIFSEHGDGADRAMMVGNSMKSDVVPAIAAGAWGIHVPFHLAWALEAAEPPEGHDRYRVLDDLGNLPELVAEIG
ncbi:HAD family hydrolase [Tropicimonas marinistellae]|uniref:HAD family hydrolase n=1 Tax=Tropicimonas marinistellae TaxID=1739787 RepID=UPI0008322A26|nr:HAD family hydrolase [Tropicimonas marinistellae]